MQSTRRALAYTFSAQYYVIAVQFVATIVIARLLTPAEIGTFSVGAALIGLGHLLRDFGSGQYVVQEQELTDQRIRAALTVTLMLGWSIAAAIFLAAPFIADYYEEPGVGEVLTLLAINFLILPFGSVVLAYCRRQMNFRPVAVANIGATTVQASLSMLLAYLGFSYMSLAWASLAGVIATIGLVTLMRPAGLPFLPGFRELRRVLSFGGKTSFITVLDEVAEITPEIVLGKTQGFHEVGLLSRTHGTIRIFQNLVLQGANTVIGPVFAKLKSKGEGLHSAYLYGTMCVSSLAWPFYINLAALASPFVLTLFGPTWADIIPYMQIWALGVTIHYLTSLVEPVFTSIGEIDRVVRFSTIFQPVRILAYATAAFFSLDALIWAVASMPLLRLALLWPHLREVIDFRGRDYLHVIRLAGIPAVASAGVTLATQFVLSAQGILEPMIHLGAATVLGAAAWLLVAYAMKHPLIGELQRLLHRNSAKEA